MSQLITRRGLVAAGLTGAAALAGGGAAVRYGLIPPDYGTRYGAGETLTYAAQRLLTSGHSMAREFAREQISAVAPINGPAPISADYRRLLAGGFRDWRLQVEGLVAKPASFSLDALKAMPAESRVLLHACEQGWSYIAEWTGVRLSHVLDIVQPRAEARWIAFLPFPNPQQTTGIVRVEWETIDMADALHPQTMLAYGMNGEALLTDHGAPVRLRMGRQLGYKNTKFLSRIVVTDKMDFYRKGRGTWYGGI
jgi:DMSO/TMAO reductase YedYZ molybdopterin-dependent catalytic subunit